MQEDSRERIANFVRDTSRKASEPGKMGGTLGGLFQAAACLFGALAFSQLVAQSGIELPHLHLTHLHLLAVRLQGAPQCRLLNSVTHGPTERLLREVCLDEVVLSPLLHSLNCVRVAVDVQQQDYRGGECACLGLQMGEPGHPIEVR